MRKLLVVALLIAVAALVLAACGSAEEPAPTAPAAPAPAPAAPPAAAPAPAAPPAAMPAKTGGTLVIGKIADVCHVDAQASGCEASHQINSMVWDNLLYMDHETLATEPLLAESWKTTDLQTYVFQLRDGVEFQRQNDKGVRFTASRELNSADVVFSFNRLKDPETASSWGNRFRTLEVETKAIGPLEVSFTLAGPSPIFLEMLAYPMSVIHPGEEVQNGIIDPTTEMLGTGPFYPAEHLQDARWVLQRHEDYWQKKLLGKDVPILDAVEWPIIPDESSRVAALRTGQIQMTFFENPKMLDLLKDDGDITTVDQLTTNYYRLDVHTQKGPLADQRVRQALIAATDRGELAKAAAFGYAKPQGIISDVRRGAPLSDVPFYAYDQEKAKQLLVEAGFPDGVDIGGIWVTPYIPLTITLGEVLQKQWAKVGIKSQVMQFEQAQWIKDLFAGDYDVLVSWSYGWLDPAMAVTGYSPDSVKARFGYEDPEFFRLSAAVASEGDKSQVLKRIRELEDYWATVAFHQGLITKDNFIGYRNDLVGDVKIDKITGYGVPLWKAIQTITLR